MQTQRNSRFGITDPDPFILFAAEGTVVDFILIVINGDFTSSGKAISFEKYEIIPFLGDFDFAVLVSCYAVDRIVSAVKCKSQRKRQAIRRSEEHGAPVDPVQRGLFCRYGNGQCFSGNRFAPDGATV